MVNSFPTIAEASRNIGINHSDIHVALDKETCTSGGYWWGTTEEFNGYNAFPKKINQYTVSGELVKTFDRLIDVEKDGFSNVAVQRCCSDKVKTSGGFVWRYEDDPFDKYLNGYFLDEHNVFRNKPLELKGKSVDKYSLDGLFVDTYKTIVDAAKSLDERDYKNKTSSITKACRGKQATAYGFIWKYHDCEESAA